jgi:3-dehydroquinate dehydratase-2
LNLAVATKTLPVLIVNGPNLNMLGVREPETYGHQTLDDLEKLCRKTAKALGLKAECKQSNVEGELVTWIQNARTKNSAIVINAGAYSHT